MAPLPAHWQQQHPDTSPESETTCDSSSSVLKNEFPTEAQLVLLCLDYLRDLRRNFSILNLKQQEGLDANYLSVAIYALSKCFTKESPLYLHNDANLATTKPNNNVVGGEKVVSTVDETTTTLTSKSTTTNRGGSIIIPDLQTINQEILYNRHLKRHKRENDDENSVQQQQEQEEKHTDEEEEEEEWYPYNDNHVSNGYRFYGLNGLASGPTLRGPLSLGELVVAGLVGLGARSREAADAEMVQSPLFEQFLAAVQSKGFFRDLEQPEEEDEERLEQLYQERYAKVVGKFRTKLAVKAAAAALQEQVGDELALSAAERQYAQRQHRIQVLRQEEEGEEESEAEDYSKSKSATDYSKSKSSTTPSPRENQSQNNNHHHNTTTDDFTMGMSVVTSLTTPKLAPGRTTTSPSSSSSCARTTTTPSPRTTSASTTTTKSQKTTHNPIDEQEAEKCKALGNAYMQQKEYTKAAEAYTSALRLSPAGPNSHVYFSNRAAAHLSRRNVEEAVLDSERSLALQPKYAKAHARLGLSHFLLGNYKESIQAYQTSLKYDPNNVSSQKYLEKAMRRVAALENVLPDNDEKDQEREAEKCKVKGNSYMASRNYQAALESYTNAIMASSNGPHSHVYFSNRAAALCYLEMYQEAQEDSLKSLELQPTYGKAHSRLGLSRFFMGDYEGAVEAYTYALQYDPDNAASKSYLQKAKDRLKRQQQQQQENGGSLQHATSRDSSRTKSWKDGNIRGTTSSRASSKEYRPDSSLSPAAPQRTSSPRDASRGRSRREAMLGSDSRASSSNASLLNNGNNSVSSSSPKVKHARDDSSLSRAKSRKGDGFLLRGALSKDSSKESHENSAASQDQRLLHNPDIQRLAKHAMADPSMLDVMLSIQQKESTK